MNAAASSPTTYPLPNIAQVRELLGMLFDGMIVKAAPKFDLSPQSNAYFGVYIAAGSCITDDVPNDALAFGRARQVTKSGWAATRRETMRGKK